MPLASTESQVTVEQLTVDATTAAVVSAFEAGGIRAILLKGPAIATRLYERSSDRAYGDTDLLVDPGMVGRAEGVLRSLGFADAQRGWRPSERSTHASEWRRTRPFPGAVDLHWSLAWCASDGAAVWKALSRDTQRLEVGGIDVEVLGRAAQFFVIVGHATWHGVNPRTRRDLDRALQHGEAESWEQAIALARRLGALPAFAFALRRVPEAAPILARVRDIDADAERRGEMLSSHRTLRTVDRLVETDARDRLRLVGSKLVPSRAFVRHWFAEHVHGTHPWAARVDPSTRTGLVAGYAFRAVWGVGAGVRGLLSWRRAGRGRG